MQRLGRVVHHRDVLTADERRRYGDDGRIEARDDTSLWGTRGGDLRHTERLQQQADSFRAQHAACRIRQPVLLQRQPIPQRLLT
jgi:hypothetical protein